MEAENLQKKNIQNIAISHSGGVTDEARILLCKVEAHRCHRR